MSGADEKAGGLWYRRWHKAATMNRELLEALEKARGIIAEIDEYQKRPELGGYGVECACCMGELLDGDREAIAALDAAIANARGDA